MVAERPLGHRVVLLRQQAGRSRGGDEAIEQRLGLRPLVGQQVGLDQPRRAQVEAAFGARQPVVTAVAVNRCTAA